MCGIQGWNKWKFTYFVGNIDLNIPRLKDKIYLLYQVLYRLFAPRILSPTKESFRLSMGRTHSYETLITYPLRYGCLSKQMIFCLYGFQGWIKWKFYNGSRLYFCRLIFCTSVILNKNPSSLPHYCRLFWLCALRYGWLYKHMIFYLYGIQGWISGNFLILLAI